VREITPEQLARLQLSALHYVENAARHRAQLRRLA
jgi:hypothetical protein